MASFRQIEAFAAFLDQVGRMSGGGGGKIGGTPFHLECDLRDPADEFEVIRPERNVRQRDVFRIPDGDLEFQKVLAVSQQVVELGQELDRFGEELEER